jgi:pseudaminic acid synthase
MKNTDIIELAKKKVFIIAELSANHNHDFDIAVKTIRAMKEAGADAVKLQTYTPDTITIDCRNKYFQIKHGTIWDGKNLYDLYKEAYTPWEWQPELKKIAEEEGLICFSSPFDKSAVDFLEKMNVSAYKVASFEITDIPLIEYIASKGKPVIISTGIAEIDDIKDAIEACKKSGNDRVALLKCTSAYPAPYEEVNLLMIPDMIKRFNITVGLSDHTIGHTVPLAAVALGARIIEKHFILDKKIGGPDAEFSMEPAEFKIMADEIRKIEKTLGKVEYNLSDKMKKSREFSRSIFIVQDVKAGDILTSENVKSIRPGYGLHPKFLKAVIGKKFKADLEKGTPLSMEVIE